MTISVTQLNNYIHGMFDMDAVLNNLSVYGEIVNVKRARDGWYFSLKDEGGAVNCFCYGNATEPIIGLMAVAEGRLNYFVKSGSVSFFVRRLTATNNTGAAYLKFVELKEKLQKEGLFDEARKQSIPQCATKIGVVTSETGAVIHDIANVVSRRQPFSDVILYPVKVQGVGAEDEIAEGIRYFNGSDVDVVIVGRGGGSNEDLSVFNSEKVVRAIANCVKPVVSAVGHGIDFTLADFAADRRAVTPSEAAEFVTLDASREKLRILANVNKIQSAVESNLRRMREQIVYDAKAINADILHKLDKQQSAVKAYIKNIESGVKNKIAHAELRLDNIVSKTASINPVNVLKRGYGYVSKGEQVVKSVAQVEVGDDIKLSLYDGSISATVSRKEVVK